ncbi:MAG: DUF3306 domain-containing protein [Gammaproteobacteria bacterium]|nr:DUF3306 domain-containing protein [Gammaproteobacteria bacterium]MBL6998652.1 DUF3306 domain-containing protein [Gammaproteobacteria bacterium]
MSVSNEENLLSRWSRRKQQTQEQSREEDQVISAQSREFPDAAALSGVVPESSNQIESEVEVLTDADMPPIESLSEDSDFSVFMSAGVSDELRNLALRKLFQAPSFNIQDGLDDYNDDYTSFEKLGDIVTCDMKHQIEMEAKKKLEQEAEKLMQQEAAENSPADAVQEVLPADATPVQDSALIQTDITPETETIHE